MALSDSRALILLGLLALAARSRANPDEPLSGGGGGGDYSTPNGTNTPPAPKIVAVSGPYQAVQNQDGLIFTNYGRYPDAPAAPMDPFPGVNLAGIPTVPSQFAQSVNAEVAVIQKTPEAIRAEAEAALTAQFAGNAQGGWSQIKTFNPDVAAIYLSQKIKELSP